MKDKTCKPNKYLSFGNSMHATLRDFNMITDKTFRTLDVLHNLLRKNWIRQGYDSVDEERRFGLRGLEMLTNYYLDPKDKGRETILIEEMIYKDFDGYTLCGKVDKIYEKEDSTIEVIDYKTGNTIEEFESIQLSIYLILAESRIGTFPDQVSLYYLSSNQKVTHSVDEALINSAIEQVHQLCEFIYNNNVYDFNPTPYCKMNCEFYEMCDGAKDTNLIVLNSLKQIEELGQASRYF